MLSNEARKNEGGKAEDVVATITHLVDANVRRFFTSDDPSAPYAPGEKNLPDRFLSSYTPNLSSLSRARADYLPVGSPSWPRLLAVAHPGAEKARLLYVKPEIAAIPKRVENITVLEGEDCSREAVLAGLKNAERIRFACHGNLDPWEPFKSRFSLWSCEAPLTLLDIISTGVLKVELAALSACHSAAGDKATPDETIRLTTDLLFAGFRTAVGTTWAMVDEDRPTVAEEFYKYMLRNGPEAVECRDTAKARSIGLKELRRRRVRVGGVVREMDQLLFTTGSKYMFCSS
ncbi:hypothetical protein FRB96_004023 [Tulasnella sp. 330]|nr:hypothetical protein FRB96_004023 [Tulasnella sp. 330]